MRKTAQSKPHRVGVRSEAAVRSIIERLELLYGKPRRMARFDPMDELVSCILSQHTSDKASFPAFTNLRATFPNWEDVVKAPIGQVSEAIKNAGLSNQKAKSIVACLKMIEERTGGYSLDLLRDMPTMEARDWLMELPGVGPKTASIVLCFSFGRETIPVDTHVFRVAKRIGWLSEKETEKSAHDTLLHIVPGELSFRFHLALIQHGRHICRAPVPQCSECPITDVCSWFKEELSKTAKDQIRKNRRD